MSSVHAKGEAIKAEIEGARHISTEGHTYWSARELAPILGYRNWEQVPGLVERASAACENLGMTTADHFRPASKLVPVGSGASREVLDFHLSRYGCYLFAMNGDPRKLEISCAQSYFAAQTHKMEVIEERQALAAAQPPALPTAVGIDFLQQFAGHVVVALEQKAEAVKTEMRAEIRQQIGALTITSEQIHEVRKLVRQVVGKRARLGLPNATFPAVYRETWDVCQVGNLAAMTRDQFPRVTAYLKAELSGLDSLGDSGLFGEVQA